MASTILWPGQEQHLCSFYIQKELTRRPTKHAFYNVLTSQRSLESSHFPKSGMMPQTRPTQEILTTTSRSQDVERSRRQKWYQENTSRNGGKSRITLKEDKKNKQNFYNLYTLPKTKRAIVNLHARGTLQKVTPQSSKITFSKPMANTWFSTEKTPINFQGKFLH